jgi:hypothetical protein
VAGVSPQPMLGCYCYWCDEPAVGTIELEPAQRKMVTMIGPTGVPISAPQATRFAITAYVCADHLEVRDREAGPVPDIRRRRARGIEQLDIFGGSTEDPRKPGNALTDA